MRFKLWQLDPSKKYQDSKGLVWEYNMQYGQSEWFCDTILCYVGERYNWRTIKDLDFFEYKA